LDNFERACSSAGVELDRHEGCWTHFAWFEVGGWRLEAANLLENNNRSILGVKQRSRSNEELASRGRTPRQHSKSNKVDTILVES